MIVTLDAGELNTEKLVTFDEIISFAKSVPASNKNITARKETKIPDDYEIFDELNEKEKGLRIVLEQLGKKVTELSEKLYPSKYSGLLMLAKLTGSEDSVSLPAVSLDQYSDLQHLKYIHTVINTYYIVQVQSRIGFGIHVRIAHDGKIYALKDLRKLHSPDHF